METESNKATSWYILLVLGISFALAGAYKLTFPEKDPISYSIMAFIYMYMPFLSAIIVDKVFYKQKIKRNWGINFNPNKWFLAAWPAVVAFTFFSLAVNLLWPGISFTSEMTGFWDKMAQQLSPEQLEMQKAKMELIPIPYWLLTIIQGLIASITINAVAGFGEESGWRGFMVKEYRNLKFWDAALRIGIVWGIWHAPLILMGHNYPEHNLIGVGMMTVWCIMLSPVFLYVRLKSKSVIAASIMHGTLNATAGIPIMYLVGGNDLTLGLTGFSGFISLLIVIGIMILYDLKFAKQPITNTILADSLG